MQHGMQSDVVYLGYSLYGKAQLELARSTGYDLHVVDNQIGWSDGMPIPGACSQCITSPEMTFTTDASGDMPAGTLLWQSVQAGLLPSGFDIAIDVDGDGYYSVATDFVDSSPRGGFAVPLPEPSRGLPLVSGLGALAGLYRLRERRVRS